MSVDSLSSPHRRLQSGASPFKKITSRNEVGSCSILFERHRFLLTALAILAFLCIIYLYFAVTLGTTETCSGLSGAEKTLCEGKAKTTLLHRGKLNLL